MADKKSDFNIITRLLIIAFSVGIILIAIFPHRKELKQKLNETKSEFKESHPELFTPAKIESNSVVKKEGNKVILQTPPSNADVNVIKAKNPKHLDNISSKDKEELDNLINQK